VHLIALVRGFDDARIPAQVIQAAADRRGTEELRMLPE
jgi:hypothetical protein